MPPDRLVPGQDSSADCGNKKEESRHFRLLFSVPPSLATAGRPILVENPTLKGTKRNERIERNGHTHGRVSFRSVWSRGSRFVCSRHHQRRIQDYTTELHLKRSQSVSRQQSKAKQEIPFHCISKRILSEILREKSESDSVRSDSVCVCASIICMIN